MARHLLQCMSPLIIFSMPADIPLEQPTKFDFVVNLKIAKAHGLAISEAFLLRADEVIK